ncbi:isochorismatase [Agromyces sp. Root81]|uniref:isochorismatase family cysteine hydrolase n=1 Tax=Agromyces sp. Root81 TaxID=1736601 RepID=UPI0006FE883C|nr:isochorismatase family cysteine hydrolase [Agromyces sp. Root81]KRC62652.1 isochorismatase [Agromyces sp. Root81]
MTGFIAEREYRRQEQRRGRRHAYEHVDPRRTALVVIDLVPFFVEQSRYARGIVPRVNRLAATVRDTAGTVAWVVPGYRAPTAKDLEFLGEEAAEVYARSGGTGDPSTRLWHELAYAEGDLAVEKTAHSAFAPGRSPLPDLLAARHIETLVVTGAVTNVCVEATVRDASTQDLRVILAADACAAARDEDHNASLHTVYRSYGDVRTTDEIIRLLHASR